jgi:hypothetical protein
MADEAMRAALVGPADDEIVALEAEIRTAQLDVGISALLCSA